MKAFDPRSAAANWLRRVDGRWCVPVRMLPYLTDWDPLSPDVVASMFARSNLILHKWSLISYRLHVDSTYTEVSPQSWATIEANLRDLAAGMATKGQLHMEWQKAAVEELPAHVFVWLDELTEKSSDNSVTPQSLCLRTFGLRHELNLHPLISEEQKKIATAGFDAWAVPPPDREADRSAQSASSAQPEGAPIVLPAVKMAKQTPPATRKLKPMPRKPHGEAGLLRVADVGAKTALAEPAPIVLPAVEMATQMLPAPWELKPMPWKPLDEAGLVRVADVQAQTALPEPVPAAVHREPAKPSSVIHKKKRRGNPLEHVIPMAHEQALKPDDWTSVWAALVTLAQSPSRPAPLLGHDEGGVKYETFDVENPVAWLNREAFRTRSRRLK